jgi:hypothetical protein
VSMRETLEVINRMEADGVIGRYAIGGAVAALYYIEIASTEDLDIFISFDDTPGTLKSGLITLRPILDYLAERGYTEFYKEGIHIEGWPVQFLPVANDLEAEALAKAREVDMDTPLGSVPTRILLPQYLIANALRIARPKDFLRVAQFLDEDAIDFSALGDVLQRHGLVIAWKTFCTKTGTIDPCGL